MNISELLSYVNPFSRHIYISNAYMYTNVKWNAHPLSSNINSERVSQLKSSIFPVKKRHTKPRQAGITNHSIWFTNTRVKNLFRKGKTVTKLMNFIWMPNGKYHCHMAARCTYHQMSSPSHSKRATEKSSYLERKKSWRIFLKKVRRMGH